jgi:hypothetical protein
MPWEVVGTCVHKKGEDKPIPGGCHDTAAEAAAHMRALYANEPEAGKSWSERRRRQGGSNFSIKQVGDSYRWVLISSNSYQDRDGEIVTQKALEDDVARADGDGEYGPLLWWHEKSIVLGQCTGNAMHNRMLIEWGTFKSAAVAEKFKQAGPNLGVSIGFNHPVTQPDADGLFHNVRRFERSALPHTVASNTLTAIPIVEKESFMLKEKIDALRLVFGGDDALVNSVISLADTQQKAADEAGIRTKAKLDDDEKKPDADAPAKTEDATLDKPFSKDEAEDDQKPKAEKKEYLGDMDPATLKHILEDVVDARMTTLKTELQTQLDTQSTTKAAAEATTAETLKAYEGKLDNLAGTVKSALDGIAELKGELPRRLGERLKGYHPSTDGEEPDESFKDRLPTPDPNNPIDKMLASLKAANGAAPQG